MQARPKEDGHSERKDAATPPGILKAINSYKEVRKIHDFRVLRKFNSSCSVQQLEDAYIYINCTLKISSHLQR